ncbi:hypothetical protein GE107_10325 [Cohnella sp. CFH 77786]|uniref:hypothetical protein n=1 Tax=Cohnella sp. CFH 77786 TaxID=2662265 RepID=UPI001C6104D7|nr:hypothetical protein [Cohnella sp. CFH 77786]MBW5446456.1 hypothetical protein [Cohnella sp. CFH 77786]
MPLYSTGPIENAGTPESRSSSIIVFFENSAGSFDTVFVQVFRLNGTKTVIAQEQFNVPPETTLTRQYFVAATAEFEVQVLTNSGFTFVSVAGVNANNVFIPQHRLVLQEMAILPIVP